MGGLRFFFLKNPRKLEIFSQKGGGVSLKPLPEYALGREGGK